MFSDIYKGRRVLITGDTGFKGSWLALWLKMIQADLVGFSRGITAKNNKSPIHQIDYPRFFADIRNRDAVSACLELHKPEIIFHLAAQPLVRESYRVPVETYEINVMGTVNLLMAARAVDSVRAIVVITSDKCYENSLCKNTAYGFLETDRLGGEDPYSSSKACAELVVHSLRTSFYSSGIEKGKKTALIASARAGNVIGGGDWGGERLIPDIVRAVAGGQCVHLRNPQAVRPWQYVLDPLMGYLMLGQKLLEGRQEFAEAWNFGPSEEDQRTVEELVLQMKRNWPEIEFSIDSDRCRGFKEAEILRLNCQKAMAELGWHPVLRFKEAVEFTAEWYRQISSSHDVISFEQLERFIDKANCKICI